jgi:hypothetical protein
MRGANPCGAPLPPSARRIIIRKCKKTLKNEKKSLSLLHMSKKSSTFAADFKKYTIMTQKTKTIIKVVIAVIIAALTALGASLGLTSCNVTRTITNESSYVQRGDTNVVIHTKIIETYDATKKGM